MEFDTPTAKKARIITSYIPIAMTRKTRMYIWLLFVMTMGHSSAITKSTSIEIKKQ